MARYCSAARLGLCCNSSGYDEKQINSCPTCSTPFALDHLTDTNDMLYSREEARLWTDETSPYFNGIRPLAEMVISYLRMTFGIGHCIDVLDTNARIYAGIILKSMDDHALGRIYCVRFIGWKDRHNLIINEAGIRPLSTKPLMGGYDLATWDGAPWCSDRRWNDGDRVALNTAAVVISTAERYLRSYARPSAGLRAYDVAMQTIPLFGPLLDRIVSFIQSP